MLMSVVNSFFQDAALDQLLEIGFIQRRVGTREVRGMSVPIINYDVTARGALAVERWYDDTEHVFPDIERENDEYELRSGPYIDAILGDYFSTSEFDEKVGLPV